MKIYTIEDFFSLILNQQHNWKLKKSLFKKVVTIRPPAKMHGDLNAYFLGLQGRRIRNIFLNLKVLKN